MGKKDERERPLVHAVWVIDPLGQHGILHFLDQPALDAAICHRVGGHVEEQKVLLLCSQHTLLRQVLGQPLTHIL